MQDQGSLVATGSVDGSVYMLELCEGLAIMQQNEKQSVQQMLERESKRSMARMPRLGAPQLASTASSEGNSRFPAALPAQQEPCSQEARGRRAAARPAQTRRFHCLLTTRQAREEPGGARQGDAAEGEARAGEP